MVSVLYAHERLSWYLLSMTGPKRLTVVFVRMLQFLTLAKSFDDLIQFLINAF